MISTFAVDKYAVKMWEAVISTFAHCVLLINLAKLVLIAQNVASEKARVNFFVKFKITSQDQTGKHAL